MCKGRIGKDSMTTSNAANDQLNAFQRLDVDQQLAVFWFVYKEMGHAITPAAPGASTVSPEIAEGLFNQVRDLSYEDQLALQRDLINKKDTELSREYAALGDTTKLLFWYLLAQGMDNGSIIPMPAGYELSEQSQQVFEQIKQLEFDQQIALFRDIVSPMGFDSTVQGQKSQAAR
jgi:hypothetical protein